MFGYLLHFHNKWRALDHKLDLPDALRADVHA